MSGQTILDTFEIFSIMFMQWFLENYHLKDYLFFQRQLKKASVGPYFGLFIHSLLVIQLPLICGEK